MRMTSSVALLVFVLFHPAWSKCDKCKEILQQTCVCIFSVVSAGSLGFCMLSISSGAFVVNGVQPGTPLYEAL